jgi:hypothetical protein
VYGNFELGQLYGNELGQSFAQAHPLESKAISTGVSTGVTVGAQFLNIGFPGLGAIVGGIISLFMSLFGPDPKDPVFGLVIVIPKADNKVVTVNRLLQLMNKRLIDMGRTWGIHDKTQATAVFKTDVVDVLMAEPKGAIGVVSGGLPTSHPQVAHLDFNALLAHTIALAKPFMDTLSQVTDPQIKGQILTHQLEYKQVSSYYYNFAKNKTYWKEGGIVDAFDEIKISGGKGLKGSLDRGFKSMPEGLNKAFIAYAGVDVISGTVVDQALANKAFKQPEISALISSPTGLLLLGLGALLLLR